MHFSRKKVWELISHLLYRKKHTVHVDMSRITVIGMFIGLYIAARRFYAVIYAVSVQSH